MKKSLFLIIVAILCLSFSKGYAEETNINSQKEKFSIGLNFIHPVFNQNENFDFPSGIYELYGSIPIKENWDVLFIIPYSTYSLGSESRSALGNITAGFKYDSQTKDPLLFEGLLSLPTISKDDRFVEILSVTDFWNMPRHLWGGLIANAEIEKRYFNSNNLYGGFGFGNILMIPTAEDNNGDVEDYLKYFVKGGYEKMNSVGFDASIKGIFFLTSEGDFENNFINMLNIGVSYKAEIFNPRLYFVLPIGDNYSEMIKHLIGLEIKVNIK